MRRSDDNVSDDDRTPPAGIAGLPAADGVIGAGGVIGTDEIEQGAPAVLGGDAPAQDEPDSEAGDWPTLEYRSRNKPKRAGALDWIRRGREK